MEKNSNIIDPRSELLRIRNPDCTACVLHKFSKNVCIMGRGNPSAGIHLIGEAPGQAEALSGRPFMGASGKHLNVLLKELGMFNMVYISNVARCRPPGNRKPTDFEAQTCIKLYMYRELDVVRPQILVLLGRTAIDNVWRRPFQRGKLMMGITSNVKDSRLIAGRFVMCTWHPSYCLRSGPKVSEELKEHLKICMEYNLLGRKSGHEVLYLD